MTELYQSKRLTLLEDQLYQRAMTGRLPAALEGIPEGQEDTMPSPLAPALLSGAQPSPGVSATLTLAERYGPQYGVDPALLQAVAQTESAGNPNAISKAGAQGLMQLMPSTQRRFGVTNPFDPDQSMQGGAQYLGFLLQRYQGDASRALAAYNAGEGNVDKYGGIPPFPETQRYVPLVLRRFNQTRLAGDVRTALAAATAQTPSGATMPSVAAVEDRLARDAQFTEPERGAMLPARPGNSGFGFQRETAEPGRSMRNFTASALGGLALLGGALATGAAEAGRALNRPDAFSPLQFVGRGIADEARQAQKAMEPTMFDRTFWDKLVSSAGVSTPALAIGALSGGATTGAIVTAFLEGGQEAQSLKEKLIPLLGEDEANQRAMKSFFLNTALVGITDRLGVFGSRASVARYIISTIGMNDLQEGVQYEIEREQLTVPATNPNAAALVALGWERQGNDVVKAYSPADLAEALSIATILGGVMSGVGLGLVHGAEQSLPEVRRAVELEQQREPGFTLEQGLAAFQAPNAPPPDVPLPTWQRWAAAVLDLLPEASTAPTPTGGILSSETGAIRPAPQGPPVTDFPLQARNTPGATGETAMLRGIESIQQQGQPQPSLLQQPTLTQAFGDLQQFAQDYAGLRETQTRGERPRVQAQLEGTQQALVHGLDVADLAALPPGTTMTDAEAAALAQRGGAQYGVTRDSAQAALLSQSDADIAKALGDFYALGRYFLLPMEGVRAESERTLGMLNDPIAGLGDMLHQVQTVLDESRSAPVTTEKDAALAILKSFAALGTPQQQVAHARKSAQAATDGVLGKIFWELIYFDLLGSPITHAANMLGNVTSAALSVPVRLVAGEVGRIHRGINWMRNTPGETAYTGEALHQIVGLMNGLTMGVRAVGRHIIAQDITLQQLTDAAINQQIPDLLSLSPHDPFRRFFASLQEGRVPSGGGKADLARGITSGNLGIDPAGALGHAVDYLGDLIRLPGDALHAGDALSQTTMQWMELHALAYRRAQESGHTGQDFWTHYATTLQQRPASVVQEMERLSVWNTLNKELGPSGQFFQKGIEHVPILRLLSPFFRIGVNTAKWANEFIFPANLLSLGLHWVSGASNNLLKEFEAGGAQRDTAIAKVALSVGMQAVVGGLVTAGLITGAGPLDDRASKNWTDAGYQPFSIRSGTDANGRPVWTSYARGEPFAMTVGTLATIHEILGQLPPVDAQRLAGTFLLAYKETIVSKTWMKNIHELTNDLFAQTDDPDKALDPLGKTARSLLTGPLLPASTFLNALRRETDPVKRSVFSLADAYMNKLPGYSKDLTPDLDFLGHPRFYPPGIGPDMVSPLYTTHTKDSPVWDALVRLGKVVGHGIPDTPKVWVEGQSNTKIQLNSQEYYELRLLEMQTPLAKVLETAGVSGEKAQRQADKVTTALKLSPERANGLTGEELLSILVEQPAFKSAPPLTQYLDFTSTVSSLREAAKEALTLDLWRKYPQGKYPNGDAHAAALRRGVETQEAQALGATPQGVSQINQGYERVIQGLRIGAGP